MKLPWVRFTVRRMMVAVAVVAVFLYLSRPFPLDGQVGATLIRWSDGSVTNYESLHDAPRVHLKSLGPLVWVFWSDDRASFHLNLLGRELHVMGRPPGRINYVRTETLAR